MGSFGMHPVLKVMFSRRQTNSLPLQRRDGFKVGLVVEGGGMRGVVSAGMLCALEYLGLLNCFDVVYGASAGGFNAAYFIAGQAAFITSAYYEVINTRSFFNYFRVLLGRPAINMQFLLNDIMTEQRPLDWQSVIESPIHLKLVAGSLGELKAKVLSGFSSKSELFAALRASATLPLVAGSPVEIGGDKFFDASMFEAIPIYSAIDDGCTHVIALLTRPQGQSRRTPALETLLITTMLAKYEKSLIPYYLKGDEDYNETRAFLQKARTSPQESPFIYSFCRPAASPTIATGELQRGRLFSAAKEGLDVVFREIVGEEVEINEALVPFDKNGRVLRDRWLSRP